MWLCNAERQNKKSAKGSKKTTVLWPFYTLCLYTVQVYSVYTDASKKRRHFKTPFLSLKVDLLGLELLTSAFGVLTCIRGAAAFLGPPLGGFVIDMSGTYSWAKLRRYSTALKALNTWYPLVLHIYLGGMGAHLPWELNQLWPYKDILCVRRCCNAGMQGQVLASS